MSRKTIEVDVQMIDRSTDELSKLIIRLDKSPKKTRKEEHDQEDSKDSGYDTGSGPLCELKKSVQ